MKQPKLSLTKLTALFLIGGLAFASSCKKEDEELLDDQTNTSNISTNDSTNNSANDSTNYNYNDSTQNGNGNGSGNGDTTVNFGNGIGTDSTWVIDPWVIGGDSTNNGSNGNTGSQGGDTTYTNQSDSSAQVSWRKK